MLDAVRAPARALRPRRRRDGGAPPRRGGRRRRLGARGVRALDRGAGRRPRRGRAADGAASSARSSRPRAGFVARARRDRGRHRRAPPRRRPRGRRTTRSTTRSASSASRKRGDAVEEGEPLAEIHARDERARRERGGRACSRRYELGDDAAGAARSCSTLADSTRASASLAACPSCPRSRPSARALAPVLDGRRFERVEILDARLTRPLEPAEVAAELEGERVAAVERRGKYLIVRFERGRVLLIHLRMTGSLAARRRREPRRRSVPPCCCQLRRRIGRRLPRRPALRHLAAARAGRARAVPRRAARRRAARRARSPPRALGARLASRRAPVKAALLDQRTRRRHREHLRRRGALARAHPSAAPGRRASTSDEVRRAAPRDPRRARARASPGRARRSATTALPDGSRGAMQDEFKVYGRDGRAVRPLRHADREDRASAAAARGTARRCQRRSTPASGGEQLVELARRGRGARARCSRRSARRRSGSAAPSSRRSARAASARKPGSSSSEDLLVRRAPCASSSAFARTQ